MASKKEYSLPAQLAAEAVGTFLIVGGGCGAVAAARYAAGPPVAAAAFGGSVMMGAFATREISGAHLNPAVTCACAVTGKPEPCAPEKAACFVAAQTVGALAAAVGNFGMYRTAIRGLEAKATDVAGRGAAWGNAFGVAHDPKMIRTPGLFLTEVFSTAALLFAINCIGDDDLGAPAAAAGPVLVGSTVGLLIWVTGPVTGCGMNPARDIGPRIVTALASGPAVALQPSPAWTYTLGPLAGACMGSFAYKAFKDLLDS